MADNKSLKWQVNNKPTTLRIRGKLYAFRSQAEAIYAIYLENRMMDGEILMWQYEPRGFGFSVSKGAAVKGYLPDFLVFHLNGTKEWVEIKGKLDPASRQKLDLFRQQVAPIKLIKTDSSEFANLKLKFKQKIKFYNP